MTGAKKYILENKGYATFCSYSGRGWFKCLHLGTEHSSRIFLLISSIAYALEGGNGNYQLSCCFILIIYAINRASIYCI